MKEDKRKPNTDPILEQVLEFSESKGLFDCGTIIVGLSGGPDSVALTVILKSLKDRRDIDCDIKAFHCNHHLRPGVCDEEAGQVRQLCEFLGIDLKVIDFDCEGFARQNHISEETAGRLLRYEAFEQYAALIEEKTRKEVRIAVAHHKDDIAETMMMNLFRGAGLEGLVNPKCRSGRIIRPLLCLKKSELIGFLDERKIKFATDLTNLQPVGTRNVWRNDLLPKISGFYNEDAAVPLARTYKLLSDDLDFINRTSEEAYYANRRDLSGYPVLSIDGIRDLHPAIRSRTIRALWLETFGDLTDFEESNLNDCSSLIGDNGSGETVIDMPFGRKAYRHGQIFAFSSKGGIGYLACRIAEEMGFLTAQSPVKIDVTLSEISGKDGISITIPDSSILLKARIIEKKAKLEYNNCSWFCPFDESLGDRVTFGNCDGTGLSLKMRKAGSKGSKELNRLMTDLKIPESARKHILFAENGGKVLWLPGYGHGIGFTNAVSYEKYIVSRSAEVSNTDDMIMFTLERQ